MTAPDGIRIHLADAQELIEMLQFLDDWLSRDEDQVHTSLARFVGHPAYGISHLRNDLCRFAFLLGADNSGRLFGAEPASPDPPSH